MPATLRFEPVTWWNRRDFVRLTRETLWSPAWPGDERVWRELEHGPETVRRGARLIYDGRTPVGRVIVPHIGDWLIVRDLSLRDTSGLPERAADALLDLAARQSAAYVRASVQGPYWPALAARGLREQKRRTTMRRDLRTLPPTFTAANTRHPDAADCDLLGQLLFAAYAGTADDDGEDVDVWTSHAYDIIGGQFGPYVPAASFVTPVDAPYHCAALVVDCAPGCGVLGQVATRPEQANRGQARRLIGYALAALAGAGYHTCFLEVTLSNANAIHLYRSLGFEIVGPEIFFGYKWLQKQKDHSIVEV
ncbi:MAG: GNAT family N-acetyltransferase [Chloroflexi bacterium]|nr:GNAT family N-acetyltransferase [Chloroflexota bacterium]